MKFAQSLDHGAENDIVDLYRGLTNWQLFSSPNEIRKYYHGKLFAKRLSNKNQNAFLDIPKKVWDTELISLGLRQKFVFPSLSAWLQVAKKDSKQSHILANCNRQNYINTGRSVKLLSWCPNVSDDRQILAVLISHCDPNHTLKLDPEENSDLIQFWDCGISNNIDKEPSLLCAFEHRWGSIISMQWISPDKPNIKNVQQCEFLNEAHPLLGHMLFCCSDGFMRICPVPMFVKSSDDMIFQFKEDNVMKLGLGHDFQSDSRKNFGYPTCAHWLSITPGWIVAGFSTGFIGIFDLTCVDLFHYDCVHNYVIPIHKRRLSNYPIKSIAMCPTDWQIFNYTVDSGIVNKCNFVYKFTERTLPHAIVKSDEVIVSSIWPTRADLIVSIPITKDCVDITSILSRKMVSIPIEGIRNVVSFDDDNSIIVSTETGSVTMISFNEHPIIKYLMTSKKSSHDIDDPKNICHYRLITPIKSSKEDVPVLVNCSTEKEVLELYESSSSVGYPIINSIDINPNIGALGLAAIGFDCGLVHILRIREEQPTDTSALIAEQCAVLKKTESKTHLKKVIDPLGNEKRKKGSLTKKTSSSSSRVAVERSYSKNKSKTSITKKLRTSRHKEHESATSVTDDNNESFDTYDSVSEATEPALDCGEDWTVLDINGGQTRGSIVQDNEDNGQKGAVSVNNDVLEENDGEEGVLKALAVQDDTSNNPKIQIIFDDSDLCVDYHDDFDEPEIDTSRLGKLERTRQILEAPKNLSEKISREDRRNIGDQEVVVEHDSEQDHFGIFYNETEDLGDGIDPKEERDEISYVADKADSAGDAVRYIYNTNQAVGEGPVCTVQDNEDGLSSDISEETIEMVEILDGDIAAENTSETEGFEERYEAEEGKFDIMVETEGSVFDQQVESVDEEITAGNYHHPYVGVVDSCASTERVAAISIVEQKKEESQSVCEKSDLTFVIGDITDINTKEGRRIWINSPNKDGEKMENEESTVADSKVREEALVDIIADGDEINADNEEKERPAIEDDIQENEEKILLQDGKENSTFVTMSFDLEENRGTEIVDYLDKHGQKVISFDNEIEETVIVDHSKEKEEEAVVDDEGERSEYKDDTSVMDSVNENEEMITIGISEEREERTAEEDIIKTEKVMIVNDIENNDDKKEKIVVAFVGDIQGKEERTVVSDIEDKLESIEKEEKRIIEDDYDGLVTSVIEGTDESDVVNESTDSSRSTTTEKREAVIINYDTENSTLFTHISEVKERTAVMDNIGQMSERSVADDIYKKEKTVMVDVKERTNILTVIDYIKKTLETTIVHVDGKEEETVDDILEKETNNERHDSNIVTEGLPISTDFEGVNVLHSQEEDQEVVGAKKRQCEDLHSTITCKRAKMEDNVRDDKDARSEYSAEYSATNASVKKSGRSNKDELDEESSEKNDIKEDSISEVDKTAEKVGVKETTVEVPTRVAEDKKPGRSKKVSVNEADIVAYRVKGGTRSRSAYSSTTIERRSQTKKVILKEENLVKETVKTVEKIGVKKRGRPKAVVSNKESSEKNDIKEDSVNETVVAAYQVQEDTKSTSENSSRTTSDGLATIAQVKERGRKKKAKLNEQDSVNEVDVITLNDDVKETRNYDGRGEKVDYDGRRSKRDTVADDPEWSSGHVANPDSLTVSMNSRQSLRGSDVQQDVNLLVHVTVEDLISGETNSKPVVADEDIVSNRRRTLRGSPISNQTHQNESHESNHSSFENIDVGTAKRHIKGFSRRNEDGKVVEKMEKMEEDNFNNRRTLRGAEMDAITKEGSGPATMRVQKSHKDSPSDQDKQNKGEEKADNRRRKSLRLSATDELEVGHQDHGTNIADQRDVISGTSKRRKTLSAVDSGDKASGGPGRRRTMRGASDDDLSTNKSPLQSKMDSKEKEREERDDREEKVNGGRRKTLRGDSSEDMDKKYQESTKKSPLQSSNNGKGGGKKVEEERDDSEENVSGGRRRTLRGTNNEDLGMKKQESTKKSPIQSRKDSKGGGKKVVEERDDSEEKVSGGRRRTLRGANNEDLDTNDQESTKKSSLHSRKDSKGAGKKVEEERDDSEEKVSGGRRRTLREANNEDLDTNDQESTKKSPLQSRKDSKGEEKKEENADEIERAAPGQDAPELYLGLEMSKCCVSLNDTDIANIVEKLASPDKSTENSRTVVAVPKKRRRQSEHDSSSLDQGESVPELGPPAKKVRLSTSVATFKQPVAKVVSWWKFKIVVIIWRVGRFDGVQQDVSGRLFDDEPKVGEIVQMRWGKGTKKFPVEVVEIV